MSRAPLLPERKRPLVFAHRGCSSLAPENTMASFKKARECGAPGIELDIHVTLDGKLIVAHDDNFLRTALPGNNGNGKKVEELTLDEIRHIDVGSFFGKEWQSERPPLLEDVLEEFCPDMYVDIELKSRKRKDDPLPILLAEKLKSLNQTISPSVTVSSFNPFCLKTFKEEWKKIQNANAAKKIMDIPTAIIWCADREVPPILRYGFGRFLSGCDYLKPIHEQVTAFTALWLSKMIGWSIVPWTVDDSLLAKKMICLGCEGIITNRPQDLANIFSSPACC